MLHNTLQTKASEMFVPARGTAIACFAMCLFCGQAIGTLLFGAIIDAYGFFLAFGIVAAGTWLLGYFFRYQLAKQ
jgi:MFS family permease